MKLVIPLYCGGSLTVIGIGTTLNQRFLLEKELGRGGMGAVYKATDQLLERSVAIKMLKEQSGEEVGKRLRLEAQIAARLLHENVVRIYDFGQAESAYFLVMEEVNGSSYSKRWRHLSLAERLSSLVLVAEALDYAHHQGVVHRDVKPANVLLTSSDVPKLSDFGLSMIAFTDDAHQSGIVRGTPHYMSPEQTRGGRLDYRTDLYSLGVMIYESATGSVPFTGPSVSIMSQHYSAVPDRPQSRIPSISNELEALILSLLAKRPGDRPGSGGIVAQALREEVERTKGREGAGPSGPVNMSGTIGLTAPALTQPGTGPNALAANGAAAVPSPPTIGQTLSGQSIKTDVAPPVPSLVTAASAQVAKAPAASPSPRAAVATVGGTGGMLALVRSPLVRRMLELVLAEPILLTAEERYLHGHYLAYLLSGSQRRGLFLRRPMESRNGDRARLLLAVTYAILADATDEAVAEAAALLDQRIEVRTFLSPIVVAKYLSCRESPARRKLFRQTRKAIGDQSTYAQNKMLNPQGVLNPGLMPAKLADLNLLAPARTDVDDILVERWNRVAEVWRDRAEFRTAVLRYATSYAHRDPASTGLWPEVVYPLIERARWHRRIRGRTEAIWNYIGGRFLHLPDAGVALDRVIDRVVPAPLVAELDEGMNLLAEDPRLDDDEGDPFAPAPDEADRLTTSLAASGVSLVELASEPAEPDKGKNVLQLADPNPHRFVQSELHDLWKEALQSLQNQAAMTKPGSRPAAGHRPVPIGPYRLIIIPSIRGRAAGQIAIQGMVNKQIELTTPTLRTRGSASKALLAIWLYRDNSLAIVHLDFMNTEHYVLWHAPKSHQLNFDEPGDLNHELFTLGMEVPDQIEKVLTRKFKPSSPA